MNQTWIQDLHIQDQHYDV